MKSKYRTKPIIDDELSIRVGRDDKRALFIAAGKQDLSVGQFVRRAIVAALAGQQDARVA